MLRIGEGYDVHRLAVGGPLRLGCVDLAAEVSAVGHSDGDAVAHAACDALLGALALGDIGTHFPPSDDCWKGQRSTMFLRSVAAMLAERDAHVINLDITVVLERPKLADHIVSMRSAVAEALGLDIDAVSIKAKTAEGMGAVGEGAAVEAHAIALVDIAD